MEMEWYYAEGSRKVGPHTKQQLAELAATGAITPDHLVWRIGTKEWVKAGTVAGLCPPSSIHAEPDVPPPLPASPKQQDIGSSPILASVPPVLKATAKITGGNSTLTNASQLASKSSERSSLRTSLSLDYLALGKEIFTSGQYQAELKDEHQQLQELTAKLSAVRQPVVQAGESYLDQAKVMAIKAKRFAEEKVLVHQMDNAFQRLGEAAYKKYGSLARSEGLSKSISEKLVKIESLDSEIAHTSGQLKANFNSSVSSGGEAAKKFFSKRPNQIVAGVIAVCLVGFAVSKNGTGKADKPEQNQVASSQNQSEVTPKKTEQRKIASSKEQNQVASNQGEFSKEELSEIRIDLGLSAAHTLGHLDKEKFINYRRMVKSMQANGVGNGTGLNAMRLALVPAKDWPKLQILLDLSDTEMRHAMNFLVMIAK